MLAHLGKSDRVVIRLRLQVQLQDDKPLLSLGGEVPQDWCKAILCPLFCDTAVYIDGSGSIVLKAFGKPSTVSLKRKNKARNRMPTRTFEIQREFNINKEQVMRLLIFGRKNLSRKNFPPYNPRMLMLKSYTLCGLFASTAVPMEQRKRKLYGTILVHCTDVRVFPERLCDEKKL